MKLAQYRCILMHKYKFLDIVSEGMITNPNGQICSSIASYEVAVHTWPNETKTEMVQIVYIDYRHNLVKYDND